MNWDYLRFLQDGSQGWFQLKKNRIISRFLVSAELFEANAQEFSDRIVTMDETRVHNYTLYSKQQSKQWKGTRSLPPKKAKTFSSANSIYYCTLLYCLRKEIKKKCQGMLRKKFCSTRTTHVFTHLYKRWLKTVIVTLNCYLTLLILLIWPRLTFIYIYFKFKPFLCYLSDFFLSCDTHYFSFSSYYSSSLNYCILNCNFEFLRRLDVIDSNQYGIESVTYLLIFVTYFY